VSHTPKLSPTTLTELPPLTAEFSSPYDATAASKLYAALAVPATPPTLTADTPYIVLTELLRHASAVADVHDDVPHTAISSAPVALRSTELKLSPTTLTELSPFNAPFRTHPDPTTASKLYAALAVPAMVPKIMADTPYIVLAELLRHVSVVTDVQDEVMHATVSRAPVAL
jgi:hypothetical protein